jgi:RHS repeat-associated protein
VIETVQYGPFGETITSTGTSPNTLQYTGREFDQETGLYYYRARYYDPEIGRFLNEDPLGFEAGINLYTYCSNNFINFNDPAGLIKIPGAKAFLTKKAAQLSLAALRRRAVKDAWKMERQMIEKLGRGSRQWTQAQKTELLKYGKVEGYVGHHINNVADHQELAGVAANIKFVREGAEHLAEHGGKYGFSEGALIDRTLGGQLPNITLRSGRTLYEWGAVVLTGGATALEVLDWLDPASAFAKCMGLTDAGAGSDIIPSQSQSPFTSASEGFVLYPNKPNTNMMQQVYSK